MKDQITDNEVIARFYGNVVIKEKAILPEYREQIQIRMPDGSLNEYTLDALPAFHLRWELLMPVVEKISRHVYDEQPDADGFGGTIKYTAYPRTFGMLSPEGKIMVRFNNSPLFEADTLIEATYKAVVDWIRFYNSTTQNKEQS